MRITVQQLESSALFKMLDFRPSMRISKFGQSGENFYATESLGGLYLDIKADDENRIDLFRATSQEPWTDFAEADRAAIGKTVWMLVCEYLYGNGVGLDEGKTANVIKNVGDKINASLKSSNDASTVFDGHEFSYMGIGPAIHGIQVCSARHAMASRQAT